MQVYLTILIMSGVIGRAIIKFNQIFKSNTFQILCTLHVMHIILTNFEEKAFGKTSTSIGFLKEKHHKSDVTNVWNIAQWL